MLVTNVIHKILTGRKDKIRSLRQGGLSGFTKRSESEYDPFGAAHSSTSISSALGVAELTNFPINQTMWLQSLAMVRLVLEWLMKR